VCTTKPAREVARPGLAGWHDRAAWHGHARSEATLRLVGFSRFFGHSDSFSSFSYFRVFRERLERVLKL